ncbi:MAG TPA: ATP-binding cassette domain-containing protein [Acidobacteriota bacterium]|nr:ATP-binding cassette domain-containing protein [Acidobacteriota bacterium]
MKKARACDEPDKEQPLVHVDCISHVYADGSIGVHKACLKLFDREILAICGPNGSGKSTLLQHLNGILVPVEGRITIMGKTVTKNSASELRRIVGLVFQDADSQLFAPTVLDDVMFGPLNQGLKPEEAKEQALQALNTVGFTELSKAPHHLSGGEKRLVAIAGVIAMKPRILVVDEPTSDLDPVNAENIERLLVGLREKLGLSVVISTHDMDLAARIADRLYILRKGSVIAEGDPRDIFYKDALLKEARLKPPEPVVFYHSLVKKGILESGLQPIHRDEVISLFTKRMETIGIGEKLSSQ